MVNSDFVRILSSEVRQRKMAIGSDGDGGGWLFAAPSNRELNEVLPTRRPSVEWRQVRCATKPVRSNQTGQRQRKKIRIGWKRLFAQFRLPQQSTTTESPSTSVYSRKVGRYLTYIN
ncbi:hypothetical protein MCOR12_002115 [Pyricularia oryzae]|nr:hypothetical protein MCOR15_010785 [Pyricularia oryzae]KAI6604921.1 hypothetical protein MCOR12_002115 [Pyricularia oryzae]